MSGAPTRTRFGVASGLAVLLLALLWPQHGARASDFNITTLDCRLEDGMYQLDAAIQYRLTDQVLEALRNGVRLTLLVHVQVRREGAWIWQDDAYAARLRFSIHYHALASLYQVEDIYHDTREDFATLNAALGHLGRIHDLPLLAPERLAPGSEYQARLKASLDVDSLPLPLRPVAYLSPSWNLSSDWRACPLTAEPPPNERQR